MELKQEFKGIDISSHNGVINWSKLDVDFVILRAGYGNNTIDKKFIENAKSCAEYGIPFGVYWFSYALNYDEAVEEAVYCLDAIKDMKVEYPVIFDFEYDSVKWAEKCGVSVDMALASELARGFCGTVERAGYKPMLYANKDYLTRYFNNKVVGLYDLWYAHWTSTLVRDCSIWQFTSSGQMAGISGNVDVNISYVNYPSLLREQGLNNLVDTFEELEIVKAERDFYKNKLTEILNACTEALEYGV